MNEREMLHSLYRNRTRTDEEFVIEYKDDIAIILSNNVPIYKIHAKMREIGFKGCRKKFTDYLVELGLWNIMRGHKKVEQPVKKQIRVVGQKKSGQKEEVQRSMQPVQSNSVQPAQTSKNQENNVEQKSDAEPKRPRYFSKKDENEQSTEQTDFQKGLSFLNIPTFD